MQVIYTIVQKSEVIKMFTEINLYFYYYIWSTMTVKEI